MRKLASVERITKLRPIPGADKIEVAEVLGWEIVVGKGEFKEGELVVKFEIDSFLNFEDPRFGTPIFEPRGITWEGKRGMRLKTIKLKKQLSQGLCMPLSKFPEIVDPEEGKDVTELLKIEKWERPEETYSNNGGNDKSIKRRRSFPSFIPRTDEERIQNYTHTLERFEHDTYEVTVKLDGSSMTVFRIDNTSPYWEDAKKGKYRRKTKGWWNSVKVFIKGLLERTIEPTAITGVCSRNIWLPDIDDSNFTKHVVKEKIIERLEDYGRNIALQGELIGPDIQDNFENVKETEYYIYNIYDIDNQRYLSHYDAHMICMELGLNYVPVLYYYFKFDNFEYNNYKELVDKILEMADGPSALYEGKFNYREGIVFKSNQHNFSFKAISNKYLLERK